MPRWSRVLSAIAAGAFLVGALIAFVSGEPLSGSVDVAAAVFCGWPFLLWLRHRDEFGADLPVSGPPEPLRPRGARRWLAPIAVLVGIAVAGLIAQPVFSILPVYALGLAVVLVVQVRFGGDDVDFEGDALTVRNRRTGAVRNYPWVDVLELSWAPMDWPRVGSGPVVRVRGGAFDTPGPTSPAKVATVVLGSHAHRVWGREQVRRAAVERDVPFTDGLIELVNSGRRRPRLPGEVS